MRAGLMSGVASLLLCVSAGVSLAQTTLTDEQRKAKTNAYGGAMALQYGITNCDIETTAKQRADVRNKLTELKQQAGLTGDLTDADVKDALDLKTDADLKTFCTGLKLTLPGAIAGLLADKPPSDWYKPAATAEAAPAPAPAPSQTPSTPAPAQPATKMVAGDWEVDPITDSPGSCMVTRDYLDKDDGNAENAVVVRNGPNQFGLAVTYANWNFKVGEKIAASLVSNKTIINGDAQWTADKTGKVLSTFMPNEKLAALRPVDQLIVKFNDGDATFEVPRIAKALDALAACASGK